MREEVFDSDSAEVTVEGSSEALYVMEAKRRPGGWRGDWRDALLTSFMLHNYEILDNNRALMESLAF